ncbi:beta-ketoacyl synthase N-terminal-like domain-containing protein [Rhodococcus sp. B7740]|uniref:beta-ketoacyl synthase N-terminal-like domain-containing protein n=1 Tax=Rhodococcus sp. B7740 TaxID=1564114 RepID=UPI000695E995|nr:beta-ketoacyl synthase N-terminal-like domain-containing protein [Rhodococcus sp. B7740]
MSAVVVEGLAVQLPGLDLGGQAHLAAAADEYSTIGADSAKTIIGRKRLLYKETATRLAACAVHRALGLDIGTVPEAASGADADTAVIVSSNLNNVDTVAQMDELVLAGKLSDVSSMQVPNASPNAVASSLAIRFGLQGPNLLISSGITGGHSAVRVAAAMLHNRRATRVVVVGVEPSDPVAEVVNGAPLVAASACVVLRLVDSPPPGTVTVELDDPAPQAGHLEFGAGGVDLVSAVGNTYGTLGVLQVAVAANWMWQHPVSSASMVCENSEDGRTRLWLARAA